MYVNVLRKEKQDCCFGNHYFQLSLISFLSRDLIVCIAIQSYVLGRRKLNETIFHSEDNNSEKGFRVNLR